VCPACGSGQFSHQGVGIQMVEKKIKRLFPAARILRLDADVSKSQKKYEEIIKNSVHGNFDIIVGTQITLKMEAHPSLKMIAFPDFDNLKGIPDFNSKELIFSMLEQAKSIVGGGGAVLIQTSHPDDSVLKIFQKELTERKKTVNPPFSRLVKIFYRGKNKKKVDTESKRVFDLLKALSGSNIDVSDPYEPFSAKKRGYYSRNILIKADPGVDIRRMSVFAVLGGLGKGWTVDVDPTSTV
jgi:primosomal protein N' (replication factor Y)